MTYILGASLKFRCEFSTFKLLLDRVKNFENQSQTWLLPDRSTWGIFGYHKASFRHCFSYRVTPSRLAGNFYRITFKYSDSLWFSKNDLSSYINKAHNVKYSWSEVSFDYILKIYTCTCTIYTWFSTLDQPSLKFLHVVKHKNDQCLSLTKHVRE